MSITVNCSIDLTEEELFLLLQLRMRTPSGASAVAMFGPILTAASTETPAMSGETPAMSGETPSVSTETPPAGDGDYPLVEPAPPLLPPKPARSRAKTNGAEAPVNSTPLAPPPPPEPLDEPAMRSLLSKVGAVHPLKVKAITNILENCGGARRLSECDPATWPTIAEEAQKVLAEYGV